MKKLNILALALSLGVAALGGCSSAPAAAPAAAEVAAPAALAGTWTNERGSVLVIDAVDPSGHFHGAFRSGVGNVDAADAFSVSGIANGDVVGFSAAFGAAGSVASWSGQLVDKDGKDALVTSWHLTRNVADAAEAQDLWSSTLSGHDVFLRQ